MNRQIVSIKLVLLIVLGLVLAMPFGRSNAFAADLKSETENSSLTYSEVQNEALRYLSTESSHEGSENWKDAVLTEGKALYDFDANLTSYVFQVKANNQDTGYMIVSSSADFPGVLESTREGSNPYVDASGTDAIYVGPLLSFKKEKDGKYKDLHSLKKVEKQKLKHKGPLSKENIKRTAAESADSSPITPSVSTMSISNYSYKLISGVPDFTWYIGCAPTSGANIVDYWDKHGYGSLNTYSSSSTLIDKLATSMSTNRSTGGTSVSNMASGMRSYWSSKGYSPTVTTYTGAFSRHKTEINAGAPSWVTTENHPVWGDHAMTGVGFEEYYDNTDLKWYQQLILHDTWDNTPKDYWIKWSSYFDYVIKVRP